MGGLVPVHGQDNTMRRPNILFCIADDAAWLHFGAYGCQWVSTPVFDSVAARGVLFENCYTPNAKSAPSRASLLTGRYSWQLGEAGNHICHFPEDAGVFTEALEEAGYDVAFTGKGWAPGNPGMKNGRRRQLTGEAWQNRKLTPPTSEMLATDYAANFPTSSPRVRMRRGRGSSGSAVASRTAAMNTATERPKADGRPERSIVFRLSGPTTRRCVTTCWTTGSRSNIMTGSWG